MKRSATLDLIARRTIAVEWTIYPSGSTGAFACGSPDGSILQNDQALEVLLAGHWIAGFIECPHHGAPRFIAQDDQSTCGLCPGMRVRLLTYQPEELPR